MARRAEAERRHPSRAARHASTIGSRGLSAPACPGIIRPCETQEPTSTPWPTISTRRSPSWSRRSARTPRGGNVGRAADGRSGSTPPTWPSHCGGPRTISKPRSGPCAPGRSRRFRQGGACWTRCSWGWSPGAATCRVGWGPRDWAEAPERPERQATLDALPQGAGRHRTLGGRLEDAERDRLWIVNPFRPRWYYRLPEMVRVHAVHARHHAKQVAEIVAAGW